MFSRRSLLFAVLVIASPVISASQLFAQLDYLPPMAGQPPVAGHPPVAEQLLVLGLQGVPNMPSEMPNEMVVGNGYAEHASVQNSASSNPMLWQQYQALQTGAYFEKDSESGREGDSSACSSCGVGGYNRCGCNTELFPWISGPGSCDQFCVGPKWAVDAGGLMMFRDDADWGQVIADVGGATTLVDQFEHGPGARVFVTGYNESGFGIQIGYEGINDWDANLAFAPVAGFTREFTYQSRLNSVEINFLPNNPSQWKLFSGFRYVQFDEDFLDLNRADRVLPAPATPAGTSQAFDQGLNRLLENRLFGMQLGGRRDAWQFGSRFTIQTFGNAGVYLNKFRREDVDVTVTRTISGDDTATTTVTELTESSSSFSTTTRNDLTEIAFVGEAGIAAAWHLNSCTAVRLGYQILALEGVGQGLAASFTPGLSDSDTLIFHGLQFGLEYRR